VQDQQRPYVNPNRQTKTPSSSSSTTSTSTTTPKTSRPISPEEYNKGNLKGGEYVMAKGGAVEDALRIANRQHFRKGGMGYTLPPGIANNAKAMQAYISENIGKMSDLQRLEALQQAEAGNQKTDQSRALPVLNVMNRAAAGYNQFKGGSKANPEELSTIKGQMMAPRQFTSFTGQTPKNLQVGVNAINRVLNNPNNPQVKSSADLVNRVASGQIPDFTNNSMYYATPGGAGRKFVQDLHRHKNVVDFGKAGAHVYAGDKNLSPVAKVNYPNVRDDLQRELAANKQAMAAERTPQASASPATPAAAPTPSATPDQMANRPQPFTPQQQAPVQAPNETSTQNFLKSQMANAPEPAQQPAAPVIPAQPPVAPSAPQQPEGSFGVDFKESKAEQPPTMGTPPVAEAPKPPEPEQMAGAQDEPIAKPMNPQGPEAPEPMAAQAEAPEPMMPEQPDNMHMAGDMGGGFDMAADGGVIKPHYEYNDGGEVGKRLQDHALRLSRKGYDEGGVPNEETQKEFLKKNLEGSAPQYDPEGGMETAKEAGRAVANMTTPGAIADAAGYLGGPSIRENVREGNYGTAALQAAGAIPVLGPLAKGAGVAHLAMSMVPKARAVEDAVALAKAEPKLRVYHGSPHKFDEFDTSKIGTGEGAQAYGHGLYFAESEPVAKQYRDKLSQGTMSINDSSFNPYRDLTSTNIANAIKTDGLSGGIETARKLLDNYHPDDPRYKGVADDLNKLLFAQRGVVEPNKGHMYEVGIHAEPEHFLDWDAPLHGQHAYDRMRQHWDENLGDPDIIAERLGLSEHATGRDLHDAIGGKTKAQAAADALNKAGITGIKYRDAGSRTATGDPTHNYVVFDPKHLEIMRRYAKGGDIKNALNLARKNIKENN
jgi:hypothetical protein